MSILISKLAGQKQVNGLDFPLLITPPSTEVESSEDASLAWVSENKAKLHELLIKHGALLLRGFPVDSSLAFERMLDSTDYLNMPYIGGAAPREKVTESRIVTANESPATEKIPFHHEMAQVPTPPGYIFFYCDTPSPVGGSTSILHSSEICDTFFNIDPQFATKVESQGVRYIRVMPAETDRSSAIGRSWKETFQVTSKEEAEGAMREAEMEWEWLADGTLRTFTRVLPAVRLDSETQRKVFFNSIAAVYTGWNDSRNKGETAVLTADGEVMDAQVLERLVSAMDEQCVNFRWHKGDVLWINNHTVLHARQPFEGDRRILASIAFKESA